MLALALGCSVCQAVFQCQPCFFIISSSTESLPHPCRTSTCRPSCCHCCTTPPTWVRQADACCALLRSMPRCMPATLRSLPSNPHRSVHAFMPVIYAISPAALLPTLSHPSAPLAGSSESEPLIEDGLRLWLVVLRCSDRLYPQLQVCVGERVGAGVWVSKGGGGYIRVHPAWAWLASQVCVCVCKLARRTTKFSRPKPWHCHAQALLPGPHPRPSRSCCCPSCRPSSGGGRTTRRCTASSKATSCMEVRYLR